MGVLRMRKITLAALLLTVSLAGTAATRLTVGPPSSRPARDVEVVWIGSGRQERLTEPGEFELRFACSHVEGQEAVMDVLISRERPPRREEALRATPEAVREMATRGQVANVLFRDEFARVHYAGEAGPAAVSLPDGQRLRVAHSFLTRGGILGLCPADSDLELARAAVPGDTIYVRGQVFTLPGFGTCVLVDDLRFRDPAEETEEPAWTVGLQWQGRTVATLSEPGHRRVAVPCAHQPGAREVVGLRLREFRMVDLRLGGQAVSAELAADPESRSYGLQGRDGLPQNHGMLFFWEQPLRPTFAMKTVSFPLSIAFIRADGTIVSIEQMQPGDRRGVRPPVPVNYVLEMEQGWFREHGVRVGDRIEIP